MTNIVGDRTAGPRILIRLIFLTAALAPTVVGQNASPSILYDGTTFRGSLDGDAHFMVALLKRGETLQLDVREERLNVSVALFRAEGKQLLRRSNFSSGYDRETLTHIAEHEGTYIVVVGATRTPPSKGSYVLETRIKEAATAADRERVRAERLLEEGLDKSKGGPAGRREAVAKLGDSLFAWRKIGVPYWEGYTLTKLGGVYEDLKDSAKALDYYGQALPRMKQAQDVHGEAATLNSIGLLYSHLGEKAKTLDHYSRALTLTRQLGNPEEEAVGLHNLAAVHADLRLHAKALDYYNQALSSFNKLGHRPGEAHSLLGLGEVYSEMGARAKAIDYFSQAAKVYKEIGDARGEATALQDIGDQYRELGQGVKALDHYNLALEIFVRLDNPRDIANAVKALGFVYSSLGEKAFALQCFQRALSLLREVGDPPVEGSLLNAIGSFYGELGEHAAALDYFKEALPRFRQVKEQEGEAETLLLIAVTYSSLRKDAESVDYLQQALPLFRSLGDKIKEVEILLFIGGAFSNLGNKPEAAGYNKEATAALQSVVADTRNSTILNNAAYIYFEAGEKQKSLDYLNRALAYVEYDGRGGGEYFVLGALSQQWKALGNGRLARFYAKLSINKYQKKRDDLQGIASEVQRSFLRGNQGGYQTLAQLLIEEGQIEQAVQVLNLYQDQKFLDFNRGEASLGKKVALSPREQAFAAQYESAIDRIGQIGPQIEELKQQTFGRQPNEQEAARLRTLEAELKAATGAFLNLTKVAEAEFARPPDERDKVPVVQDVVEMQSALRELSTASGQRTAALYTLIGASKLYLILLTPDGGVRHFESPIREDDLNKRVVEFYALLQSPSYDPRPLGEELYNLIFKPAEAALEKAGAQTLMWQLDGSLRYVPMAVLFDGKRYLVERYQHVVFTRTDVERMLRTPRQGWTGTGFGTSQGYEVDLLGDGNKIPFLALPGVLEELRSIFRAGAGSAGVLSGAVLTDRQFTKAAFYEAMKQRRPLVHISSHFAFRPGDDSRSFLLMGDGTALTLSEMKRQEKLFDGVELLTLSACNTAATQSDASGKEIDGFAELAQRLGAHAVMATLWQVSDSSTPWLMRSFYSERQSRASVTKAAALRNAQLALLNGTAETKSLPRAAKGGTRAGFRLEVIPDGAGMSRANNSADIIYVEARNAPPFKGDESKPYAHPHYWSPFVLYGNAR